MPEVVCQDNSAKSVSRHCIPCQKSYVRTTAPSLCQDIAFHARSRMSGQQRQVCVKTLHSMPEVVCQDNSAKSVSRHCIPCQKSYVRTTAQLMGQLPADRVNPSAPFQVVRVDFAGPFVTRLGNQSQATDQTEILCCSLCMSLHLELCFDLSTPAMSAALSRFVSRRGLPSKIVNDNGSSGTNFVGAA